MPLELLLALQVFHNCHRGWLVLKAAARTSDHVHGTFFLQLLLEFGGRNSPTFVLVLAHGVVKGEILGGGYLRLVSHRKGLHGRVWLERALHT